jgi:hypothetical protein
MKEFLLAEGVVSKSWIGGKYCGHLLHLDPQTRATGFATARLISLFATTTISRSIFDF